MDWIEEEGKSIDEAIERALSRLRARREEVVVEVLEENRPLLGFFGSANVRIRVGRTPTTSAVQRAVEILEALLQRMGVNGTAQGQEENGTVSLKILSSDGGLLIGRHGETIDALQYLVNRIVNRRAVGGERTRVVIDTAEYRERRIERLQSLARKAAQEVKSSGKAVTLAPMSSWDRRVIHLSLKNDRFVETFSTGDGDHRQVMIALLRRREEAAPELPNP
ncbi:MAG: KH domain-containing protein [Candidatus Tectomicrobia bacterium]|uniref:RNA-binding protein KhpB n=1 Tax=Tectimicrobiota bacterium TaxID=2528274 RepID=A0A932M1C2_UNCTE|nr:KH domain-containing protein [Candidatus Tectomicrobia bacterium]